MDVEILHEAQAELGEGPAWDAKTKALYWVDILKKRLHIYREGADRMGKGIRTAPRDALIAVRAFASVPSGLTVYSSAGARR